MKIINTLRRNWKNVSRIEKVLLGSAVMLTGTTLFNDAIGYYVSNYKRTIIKN
jgi:cell division protein FtsL